MPLEFVLFDLDDTIYPKETPIMSAIGERIKVFLMDILNLTYEEATDKRAYYNYRYGTVLRGLLQEETVDVEIYLEFVHDIPVADFLIPNPPLGQALARLSLKKYIFTNSYRKHAENVMNALGVAEYFDGIFDIQTVNYVSKPAKHSYTTVLHLLDTTPEKCIYIDDKTVNLKEPNLMGMKTILVDAEPNQYVTVTVDNAVEACYAVEQLVEQENNHE